MSLKKKIKVKRYFVLSFVLITSNSLISCNNIDVIDKNKISVMLESGEGFSTFESILTQERGSDFTFKILLEHDTYISSVSYKLYSTKEDGEYTLITFEDVMFPTVISITTSKEYVSYYGNGGTFNNDQDNIKKGKNENHLNFNTLSGFDYIRRDGYLLNGWLDENNNLISLGSRASRNNKNFKASWIKESNIENFEFEECQNGYKIIKYLGNEEIVVLPSFYKSLQVKEISKEAFINKNIKELYFNPYLDKVNFEAFKDSTIDKLIFFDNLIKINDKCFLNTKINFIRINAVRKPRYSGTFFSSFSDKMDYLKHIKDNKKIVLFSGSSTRYGYDSPLLKTYFPKYEVVNMGVYAYFSAKLQLDIINNFLLKDDVVIDAPEFDAPENQMFENKKFEHRIFNMFESDYDNLNYLNISSYKNVFNAFNKFQNERNVLPPLSYRETVFHLDDDGNYFDEEIYNINGDFILEREGDVKEGIISQQPLSYVKGQISDNQYETFNNVYEEMKSKGVHFFFNYAPRNIDSLIKNSTIENRKIFEKEIIEKIKAPFLSTMDDYLYPADHFYLIDNHLTSEGARKRTILTANNLKRYLK